MGNHTWFYRPIKKDEVATDTCEYSHEKFGDDRYTDSDTPHDIFRVHKYREDKFLNLEQTLEFIEKNKDIVALSDNWKENLENFWTKNPDGVIEFG